MKAENTLQLMMDFYGTVFYTRTKCLEYLFCEIDNGFKWVDGELVDTSNDERFNRYVLKEDIKRAEPVELVRNLGELKEEKHIMMLKRKNVSKHKIEEIIKERYVVNKKYSYICNYPKDIKSDWLALIEEFKEVLKENGVEVPSNQGYNYAKV